MLLIYWRLIQKDHDHLIQFDWAVDEILFQYLLETSNTRGAFTNINKGMYCVVGAFFTAWARCLIWEVLKDAFNVKYMSTAKAC
jgi:hypothetical protein